jgi:hypothetical protein
VLLLPQVDTGWPKLPAWQAPTQLPLKTTWLQSPQVLLVTAASVEGLQTAERQQDRQSSSQLRREQSWVSHPRE